MKLRLEEISKGQEEVIVRYRQMNATVQAICDLVQTPDKKLLVSSDGATGDGIDMAKALPIQRILSIRSTIVSKIWFRLIKIGDFFEQPRPWFSTFIGLSDLRANPLGGLRRLWTMGKRCLFPANMLPN